MLIWWKLSNRYLAHVDIEPVMKRNETVSNGLLDGIYTKEANDKIPDNCKYIES